MKLFNFTLSLIIFSVILQFSKAEEFASDTYVYSILPRTGGRNGGVKLTLYGKNFLKSLFSLEPGSESKRTNVVLISEKSSYECDLHVNDCTDKLIVCYTRRMPTGKYWVRLTIENRKVPLSNYCHDNAKSGSCAHYVKESSTPQITSLEKQSGPPESLIRISGRIFTVRFGSNQLSANATNGRLVELLRFYFGGLNCQLMRNTGKNEPYEMILDGKNGELDTGNITCKLSGSYVGNLNGSFLVSGEFGRSETNLNLFRVSRHGKIYTFQTYAVIDSVTPNKGGTKGGTLITIKGKYFDETDAKAKVTIGGEKCQIKSLSNTEIVCKTPKKSNGVQPLIGNRGILLEKFSTEKTLNTLEDIRTLSSPTTQWMDETNWQADTKSSVRSKFYFTIPQNSSYVMALKSNGPSKLYLDDTLVVQCTDLCVEYEKSNSKFDFIAGDKHLVEILHYGNMFEIGAYQSKSKFSNNQIGGAIDAAQIIKSEGTIKEEMQKIDLTNLKANTGKSEIKTVKVTTSDSHTKFHLMVDGLKTPTLNVGMNYLDMGGILKGMPGVYPGDVMVEKSVVGNNVYKFKLKFGDNIGSRNITGEINTNDYPNAVIEIVDNQVGVASSNIIRFKYEDFVSDPVHINNKSFHEGLTGLFSIRCHAALSKPIYSYAVMDNYEVSTISGQVDNEESFCGVGSMRNGWVLYRAEDSPINIKENKYLCLAYKGRFTDTIRLRYKYFKLGMKTMSNLTSSYLQLKAEKRFDNNWHYECFNMPQQIEIDLKATPIRLFLYEVNFGRAESNDRDIFVDNFYIGTDFITERLKGIEKVRILPPFRSKDMTVEELISDKIFQVSFLTWDCKSGLELLKIDQVDVSEYTVSRIQPISVAANGLYEISLDGETVEADLSYDEMQLKLTLEENDVFGSVAIKRYGICYNRRWKVTFITKPGFVSLMTVSDKSKVSGDGADVEIINDIDGALFHNPISGDMLSTYNDQPQVIVEINNIPSRCLSNNCQFTYDDTLIPIVNGISPMQGQYNSTLTITGSGFEENFILQIGQATCDTLVSVTSTNIVCNLGWSIAGDYEVEFLIKNKGRADTSGLGTFKYLPSVNDIFPKTAGPGGAIELEIIGSGFNDKSQVNVGGNDCPIRNVSSKHIICLLPASNGQTAVAVEVVIDSQTYTSPTNFVYNAINGVYIMDIDMGKLFTDNILIINGTGFGVYKDSTTVNIGKHLAVVESWSDTQIIISTPKIKYGKHAVMVNIDGYGILSDISGNLVHVENKLVVEGFQPKEMSMYGGEIISVYGKGFGTDKNKIKVNAGDISCNLLNVNDTLIKCQMEYGGILRKIKNSGVKQNYGNGYAWKPKNSVVEIGDRIIWEWNSPKFVNLNYTVYETTSINGERKSNGFSSDDLNSDGSFEIIASKLGKTSFSSGFVDEFKEVKMNGLLEVVEKVSFFRDLVVKVDGQLAKHNLVNNPPNSNDCPITPITGCIDTKPTSNDSSISFWSCLTPTIENLSPNNGTINTQLQIDGKGFTTNINCIQVYIGDTKCNPISATDNQIKCILDVTTAKLYIKQELKVIINGRGYAKNNIEIETGKFFQLFPHINSIWPKSGSILGGTNLLIEGGGFAKGVIVRIGNEICQPIVHNFTSIVCVTKPSINEMVVGIEIKLDKKLIECGNDCEFKFEASTTPVINSISPNVIDKATSVTIDGANFESNVNNVSIGDSVCVVSFINDSSIICDVDAVKLGQNNVNVLFQNKGRADVNNNLVTGKQSVLDVIPTKGSKNGGTIITIRGNGFDTSTKINIGGKSCKLIHVSLSKLVCSTPSGMASVKISISGSVNDNTLTFTYDDANTPVVNSISPSNGIAGQTVTISGTGFDSNNSTEVFIGDECLITSKNNTEIICELANNQAGTYNVKVTVDGGIAVSTVNFIQNLKIDTILPSYGGLGGNQLITLKGSGFKGTSSIKICDGICVIEKFNTSEIQCRNKAVSVEKDCVINIDNENLNDVFHYVNDKTPIVNDFQPKQGGSMGGSLLRIKGSGFGSLKKNVLAKLGDKECTVRLVNDNLIICKTPSGKNEAKLSLSISDRGTALNLDNLLAFQYKNVWSSIYTWGGRPENIPKRGDMVVIPPGQNLMLDVDTPILKMLLIQGKLLFDEVDVELKAENILILDGGSLQIGTEEKPFQHKAIITLYGNLRALELPVYGAKTLALRNGTLDLHGLPVQSWTVLDESIQKGSGSMKLQKSVNWKVGNEIVIASTGGHLSQNESEVRVIQSISNDGKTITVNKPFEYDHLGITQSFQGGTTMETRAEVGLLTRNVIVRGSQDAQWQDKIEACPDGFDVAEFATQTCFQGRFGEEIGSDQFGGAIMIHQPEFNGNAVKARIENVELTYMGQAFKLGRYPIHFHLNGDLQGSYVRGCAIHRTFNRAVNIHNTHNILVEHNFIYNIMGGAFFLEDSIETGNIFQYNLAIFVRSSSSLLNDDVSAAAFWVTHPSNIIRHNHVAGGTHFGFWYRMLDRPQGPSYDANICPRKAVMGEFFNNTVHSNGWYGLWIFEDYHPTKSGKCKDKDAQPAIFKKLTTWNSFRGAEWVHCGAIQLHDFTMANNFMSGIEMYFIIRKTHFPYYSEKGAMLKDITIIGHLNSPNHPPCTKRGLVLPFANGLLIDGVQFINFDGAKNENHVCSALGTVKIICVCNVHCSGYNYKFKNVKWFNTNKKADWEWEHQAEYEDLDGSLTGLGAGSRALAKSDLFPNTCKQNSDWSPNLPGVICQPTVNLIRFSFNQPLPKSLLYKNVILVNKYGRSVVPYADKRDTFAEGWMALLESKIEHTMYFENATQISNFSYVGGFYGLENNDYLIITHNLTQDLYDSINVVQNPEPINYQVDNYLSYGSNENGQWHFQKDKKELSYIISDRPNADSKPYNDRYVNLKAENCLYENCIVPDDTNSIPPAVKRPPNAVLWSENESWLNTPVGYGGNGSPPKANTNVIIPEDVWMIADIDIPELNNIEIYGTLEIEPFDKEGKVRKTRLSAQSIFIRGGRLIVGWEDKPFEGEFDLVLRGSHTSIENKLQDDGAPMGTKSIGVFGGLDLHGLSRTTIWTNLQSTANKGENVLHLVDQVDWKAGEKIVISTTSYSAWQTETFNILSVSNDNKTITLDEPLKYKHAVSKEILFNRNYITTAQVGLLSRNVRVIGESYDRIENELFGARILIGLTTSLKNDMVQVYRGFGRISNVEFYRTGQEGFVAEYDARFSIAWIDAGLSSYIRPSYCRHNSFHDGFSSAIGLFNTHNVSIFDNVIHHTLGSAIITNGNENKIEKNLAVLSIFTGSYNGRYESSNVEFFATIQIENAVLTTLKNNVVAGSERVGYRLDGVSCKGENDLVKNNIAQGVLNGIWLMKEDCLMNENCSKFDSFQISKAWYFGVYVQIQCSAIFTNLTLIDNTVGIFTMILYPSANDHLYERKYVQISDSIVVGNGVNFDCNVDQMSSDDKSLQISTLGQSWFIGKRGKSGISWPLFASKDNMAPEKPHKKAKKEPAMYGILEIENVIFAHFTDACNSSNKAFSTNPAVPDAAHPIHVKNIKLHDVNDNNLVYIHRPDLNLVNDGDCVDMDCDGMKKSFIKDLDGSLLSKVGAVIPQSEFEWDGDKRRGLGDYRIPKTLLTDMNGQRIDIETVRPHKGIVRNSKCIYKDNWQAYQCHNLDYELMLIESLDEDYETRRLSPVAVRSQTGYLDLINGPRDVGICHGYTCRKRLSLFYTIVANEYYFDIHFTSTTPQSIRLHLPNANGNQVVRLSIYYGLQQIVNAYVDDKMILGESQYLSENKITYRNGNVPVLSKPSGSNYYDLQNKTLHVILRGGSPVVLKLKTDSVIVKLNFPSISVSEFFGANVVKYLQMFLGLEDSQIKVVQAVEENNGRKRRSINGGGGGVKVMLEIGDYDMDKTPIEKKLSDQDLQIIVYKLKEVLQSGKFSADTGLNIENVYVHSNLPPSSVPNWESNVVSETSANVLSTVDKLVLYKYPGNSMEGVVFTSQPYVRLVDKNGIPVMNLVTAGGDKWQVMATLKRNLNAAESELFGKSIVDVIDGWGNFTNLGISHWGENGFQIDFEIHKPSYYKATVSTGDITVKKMQVNLFVSNPSKSLPGKIPVIVTLVDSVNKKPIGNINWKGQTWKISVSNHPWVRNPLDMNIMEKVMNKNGDTIFLELTKPGKYMFTMNAITNAIGDHNTVSNYSLIEIINSNVNNTMNKTIRLKFTADYDQLKPQLVPYMEVALYNDLKNRIKSAGNLENITFQKGSIYAQFGVIGDPNTFQQHVLEGVKSYVEEGCHLYLNGKDLTCERYMLVDGKVYENLNMGDDGKFDWKLKVLLPICLCIVVISGIIVVVFLVKKYKKPQKFNYKNNLIGDVSREVTCTSLNTKLDATNSRPVTREGIVADMMTPRTKSKLAWESTTKEE